MFYGRCVSGGTPIEKQTHRNRKRVRIPGLEGLGKIKESGGQFHQPFGAKGKSTCVQCLVQKMPFSFTNKPEKLH